MSVREIADRVHAPSPMVTDWRKCRYRPGDRYRKLLEVYYGIGQGDWLLPPTADQLPPITSPVNASQEARARVAVLRAAEEALAAARTGQRGTTAGIEEALQAVSGLLQDGDPAIRISAARVVGQLRVMLEKVPENREPPAEVERHDLSQLTDLEQSIWRYLVTKTDPANAQCGFNSQWEPVLAILEVLLTRDEVATDDLAELRAYASPLGIS